MPITRLEITDFRNIPSAKFEPLVDGFNLIHGDNGSGKTSLLESIYYLSLGRSFRSSNVAHIVRKTAEKFSICTSVITQSDNNVVIGIERQLDGSLNARMAGEDVKTIAEIAHLLPVQLINSNCHNLLDSGPNFRRKYLDWGVFYQNNEFLRVWRQFRRVLKQRNMALARKIAKKELDIWSNEVSQVALTLHELRSAYVKQLLPVLNDMISQLLPLQDLKLQYYPGWDVSENYLQILTKSLDRDMQLGHTQFGPHRANLSVVVNGLPAKDILSRGQQKLFVCAMILAQGALLFRSKNKRPIYLVDDLPSELDQTSRSNLIGLLSKQEAQVFVTAVEPGIFDNSVMTKSVKLFHVEHGQVI